MSYHLLHVLAFASGITLGGVAFGIVYFMALRRSVDLYCAGRSPLGLAALAFGRIAAAVLIFALPVALGAVPLLAAFLGFLVGRVIVLRGVSKG